MKKLKKQYFTVRDSVFQRKVHVLLNFSEKEYYRFCKQKDWQDIGESDPNFTGWSAGMSAEGEPTEWIIVIKNFQWTISHQGTLVHEIVHTVMKIFSANNIPFQLETQEFIAHIVGNMYEDIAREIHKRSSGTN